MIGTATIAVPARELIAGQHLDQPTFHALYEATAPGTRAELIDGVVFMPSPVGYSHSRLHSPAIMWLGSYEEQTPGVEVLVDSTVILGPKSEVQPDAILRLLPEFGGRSRIIENYVHQAPEFVLEVSKATRYHDLGPKLKIYELADVLEYVVIAIDPDEIRWFRLEKGVMTEQSAGTDSLYRSSVFPGLWLDPSALIAGDTKRQRDVVSAGCETPEHADFVAKLARARASR